MLTTAMNVPNETVIGALTPLVDAELVLQACRGQLTRVKEDVRSSWRSARLIEALYHPKRYVRVVYALMDDPATPASRLWPEGQLVYFHAPVRRPMSRRGTVLELDGQSVEAYAFPQDRRLRGLRTFARRDRCAATWQKWSACGGNGLNLNPGSLQRLLVRYVPEQKWIVRLRGEWGSEDAGDVEIRRIAVRACRPSLCTMLTRRHSALESQRGGSTGFRVPKVVGAEVEQGLLAVEWIRGETLLETLRRENPSDVMKEVAQRLATWHSTKVNGLPTLTPAHQLTRARHAAEDLAAAYPSQTGNLQLAVERLSTLLQGLDDSPRSTLHNDFHWNQLSIKKDRFVILDLDRMAEGDPTIDVATLASQLQMLGVREEYGVRPAKAEIWRSAWLEAWASVHGQPVDLLGLNLYSAIARLDLARGMLRHLRPGWQALVSDSLRFVESDLRQAESGGRRS
ncbi:MAG: phosphotransferase [Planctomycetota bacterium]